MGFIKKVMTIEAARTRRVKALIDTGADKNYITRPLQRFVGASNVGRQEKFAEYVLPTGEIVKSKIVYFTLKIDRKPFDTHAIVVNSKKSELIIGVNFLQKNSMQLMGERLILPKFPVLKIHRI